jgi:hypothetical protein
MLILTFKFSGVLPWIPLKGKGGGTGRGQNRGGEGGIKSVHEFISHLLATYLLHVAHHCSSPRSNMPYVICDLFSVLSFYFHIKIAA